MKSMTKAEFLARLQKGVSCLPQADAEERLSFYSEMIDDRIEDGLSEEDAVAEIGNVDEIIAQIIADAPLSKLVKEKIKPKRHLSAWEIVLLVLGSPLWLSLLIAAISVIFSVFVVLWSLIISLWAVFVSLLASALGAFGGALIVAIKANALTGVAMLGAGLVCVGLSIFFFFLCKTATRGAFWLTKKTVVWIKRGIK